MRRVGLEACQPRAYRRTTVPGQAPPPADHVRRDFTASRPGEKLAGDITHIRTGEGWLYLATVIDLCSRKVAGWSMANHMRTELIIDAFTMTASRTTLTKNATFHSDRGAQYTSDTYHRLLKCHGARPSVGATACAGTTLPQSRSSARSRTNSYTGTPVQPAAPRVPRSPSTAPRRSRPVIDHLRLDRHQPQDRPRWMEEAGGRIKIRQLRGTGSWRSPWPGCCGGGCRPPRGAQPEPSPLVGSPGVGWCSRMRRGRRCGRPG